MPAHAEITTRDLNVTGDELESLYRRNGFRVLGLPVHASPSEVHKRRASLERRLRAGVPLDGLSDPSCPVDESGVARASERLADPRLRLLDEVLWFWGDAEAPHPELATALAAFRSGDREKAFGIWRRVSRGKRAPAIVARHDQAVAAHLLALEEGLTGNGAPPSSASLERTLERWSEAGAAWGETCARGCVTVADFLDRRVRKIDDPRYTPHLTCEISDSIPVLVASTFVRQARAWQKAGLKEGGDRLHAIFAKSPFAPEVRAAALEGIARPLLREIDERLRAAEQQREGPPWRCFGVAMELAEVGRRILSELEGTAATGQREIETLGDSLSEAIVLLQVRYGNATKDWRRSEIALGCAREFARSEKQTARVDEELGTIRDLAANQGAWSDSTATWGEETEERILRWITKASKDNSWGEVIERVSECVGEAAKTESESFLPLERVWAFLHGQRALAVTKNAVELLGRPTPQTEAIRQRVRELSQRRDTHGIGEILAESLSNPYGSSRCAACGRLIGNGETVATIQVDDHRWILCQQCRIAHQHAIDKDNRAAKPLIASALADTLLVREVLDDDALWSDLGELLQERGKQLGATPSLHAPHRLRRMWRKGRAPEPRRERTAARVGAELPAVAGVRGAAAALGLVFVCTLGMLAVSVFEREIRAAWFWDDEQFWNLMRGARAVGLAALLIASGSLLRWVRAVHHLRRQEGHDDPGLRVTGVAMLACFFALCAARGVFVLLSFVPLYVPLPVLEAADWCARVLYPAGFSLLATYLLLWRHKGRDFLSPLAVLLVLLGPALLVVRLLFQDGLWVHFADLLSPSLAFSAPEISMLLFFVPVLAGAARPRPDVHANRRPRPGTGAKLGVALALVGCFVAHIVVDGFDPALFETWEAEAAVRLGAIGVEVPVPVIYAAAYVASGLAGALVGALLGSLARGSVPRTEASAPGRAPGSLPA